MDFEYIITKDTVSFKPELPVKCNQGVKGGGFSSLSQKKVKDISPKRMSLDCCYRDRMSPMSDDIYDQIFQESVF